MANLYLGSMTPEKTVGDFSWLSTINTEFLTNWYTPVDPCGYGNDMYQLLIRPGAPQPRRKGLS